MTAHQMVHEPPSMGGTHDDVTGWRVRQMLEVGFAPQQALELATNPGVDLHALLDLVGRGCPPRLAARILSPLSDPPQPA